MASPATDDRPVLKRTVQTVWTVALWIFRSPTMLSVIVGVGIGYYIGSNVGQARVLPRAVKAEQALAELQTEMARAIERAAVAQVTVRDEVRRNHEDQKIRLDALGRRLGDVSRGVSLCGSSVAVPIPDAAAGAGDAGGGGQPVPADQVLQELAASIAATCDRNGAQLNALIDWLQKTQQAGR